VDKFLECSRTGPLVIQSQAELLDEVQESRRECNLFRSKLREKELAFDRLENDIMFMKVRPSCSYM